ncbi:MAG TPA: hypothetical protein DHU59_01915, partial [Clostridiales bacterium]|nr:hypothetical protein [Clostridiales bacterium]
LDSIKEEASEMTKEAYERSINIIRDNEDNVRKIAEYLLKNETMNADELDRLMDEKKKRALI